LARPGSFGTTVWQSAPALKAELAQGGMILGPPPKRPVIFAFPFGDGKVVDAGDTPPHQAVLRELPVLVAVAPETSCRCRHAIHRRSARRYGCRGRSTAP